MSVKRGLEALSAEKRQLLALRLQKSKRSMPRLERGAHEGPLPLSFGEQGLWFVEQQSPSSDRYNVAHGVRWRGALDPRALEDSVKALVERHEVLRTTYHEEAGAPLRRVGAASARLAMVDLTEHSDREHALAAFANEEARRPFALTEGPLLRATLFRLGPTEHVLLLVMHHIVNDGWSTGILLRELGVLYRAFAAGEPAALEPLPYSYIDWIVWQRRWVDTEHFKEQLASWTRRLTGAPTLELPTDRPRPPVKTSRGAAVEIAIPEEQGRALVALGQAEGATPFVCFLAVFAVVLSRYSGQEDIVVGTPLANRAPIGVEPVVGFFVNMVALRIDLAGAPDFRALIHRVKDVTVHALENGAVPFERVVDAVHPVRDGSRAPLYDVSFRLDVRAPLDAVEGAVLEPYAPEVFPVEDDLSLIIEDLGGRFKARLEFNTDLFDRSTIERYSSQLVTLLDGATKLTDAERRKILLEWNATSAPFPADRRLHELFEDRVRTAPDATAVVFEEERWSYGELNRRANRLARQLRACGVGPNVLVGVSMEPSLETVASLLAVLKAGGAFVPIDPEYPKARVRTMLRDAATPVLLTQRRFVDAVRALAGDATQLLAVDELWPTLPNDDGDLPRGGSPRDLAFVIYTSDATGNPKGAMNAHTGIVNRLTWMQHLDGIGHGDRVLQKAPFSSDVAVWELFWPLIAGAELVVARPGGHRDPRYLVDLIQSRQITTIHFVPTMLRSVVGEASFTQCTSLRRVICSGEDVPPDLANEVLARSSAELRSFYGPTECAVDVAHWRCERGAPTAPIGRPGANVRMYVLDERLEPLPVGLVGEIFVGGVAVGLGYHGRPALTAASFVPDPFSPDPGARLYRTGDRGRWREDGVVEYVGRVDGQVKVRGFRVELGEIESALRASEGVKDAVVLRESAGDKRIVAYVVPAEGKASSADALTAALEASLPEYMVPSAFVFLDAIPLGPSGKVDRRALPAPDSSAQAKEYVAPRTPLEETIAGVFAEVLNLPRVGVHDDFFALGGHSLLATRLVARLTKAFGASVSVRTLFQSPSVAALAKVIGAPAEIADSIARVDRAKPLRVSFAQERLWFLDQLSPGSTEYSVPTVVRLSAHVDTTVLERALREVVARHESFRTTFTEANGELEQVVHPAGQLVLARYEATSEAEAREIVAKAVHAPFDLERGPLFRPTLVRLPDGKHLFVLSVHHIVTDGWSQTLAWRELWSLYDAFAKGEPSPLAPRPLDYADYAAWQRQHLVGNELERQLRFWKTHLQGAPPALELPTDHPRPALRQSAGGLVPVRLPEDLSGRIKALCRTEGVTPFMVLLAGYQAVLSRWSGQDDVVVGAPIAGRTREEMEGIVGLFVNTLALRTRLAGRATFREVLSQVKATTLEAFAHQEVPFEKLVDELGVVRDTSRTPVFQAMFAMQNFDAAAPRNDARYAFEDEGLDTAKCDLSLTLWENEHRFVGDLTYDLSLFERSTIERMAGHLVTLLDAATRDLGREVAALPLIGEEERRTLAAWNDTAHPLPSTRLIHQQLEDRVDRAPSAVAIVDRKARITYAELDRRANRVARVLRRSGVDAEARVAILLERSIEMVVAQLAVLKLGATYVPLDATNPRERIAYTIEDSGARVLVSTAAGAEGLGDGLTCLLVDSPAFTAAVAAESDARIATAFSDRVAAYVIYTSGTTGRPKGTVIEHRGVVNMVAEHRRALDMAPSDRVAFIAAPAFDASPEEIWAALTSGGALYAIDDTVKSSPPDLAAFIRENALTLVNVPTALLELMLDEDVGPSVRVLSCGGQALKRRPRAEHPFRVVNFYGPTETTSIVTTETVAPGDAPITTIGRPIHNARTYVLHDGASLAPIGVAGELYIGGIHVSRGYLNRPSLTAERFVPDPFSDEPGARMYRSGDRARWRADGTLEYLGRTDHQVKIRGFRIELGEIESTLSTREDVAANVVVVGEDGTGGQRLVAYVAPVPGRELTAAVLKAWLVTKLPAYMVPSAFVFLDELPVNANGKVDRKALPAPDAWGGAEAYVAPRTPAEELIASAFTEVLKIERAGVHDDFFALGGHSLLATRLVARLTKAFGVSVSVRTLFQSPSVAALAKAIGSASASDTVEPIARLPRTAALRASFAQERMWFLDRLNPGSTTYSAPTVLRLSAAVDTKLLERALRELVTRHESFRTTFTEASGELEQIVHPATELVVARYDASSEAEARDMVRKAVEAPFDLERGPLFRPTLVRLPDGRHLFVLNVHHIVTDGWSHTLAWRELWSLYDAFATGAPSPLAPRSLEYADYAAWQRGRLVGETVAKELRFWKTHLEGAPPALELPTDHPRPAMRQSAGGLVPLRWSEDLSDRIKALCRAEGVTPFMVLLAGYQAVLSRWSGQDDVVVGVPIAGRMREELEGMVGLFVNTLALRTRLGGRATFREVLSQVKATTLEAFAHQEVPFEKLVDELGVARDTSRTPVFQATFAMQNYDAAAPKDDARYTFEESGVVGAKTDLSLALWENEGRFEGDLTYDLALFEHATIERLAGHLVTLLDAATRDAERAVAALPLMSEAERRKVLVEWNGERTEPTTTCLPVHEQFEAQVDRTPDALALVGGATRWSYRELDERANRLANELRARGVRPGDLVALWMNRSAHVVLAQLAVMKAGACWAPLDPEQPTERLAMLLADLAPRATLVTAATKPLVAGATANVVSADEEHVAASTRPAVPVHPSSSAYVLFTSGSTGKPKGVVIGHDQLATYVASVVATLALPAAAYAHASTFAADLGLTALFPPLVLGGSLHVIDDDVRLDPKLFEQYMAAHAIDVLKIVPSHFLALSGGERGFPRRVLVLGGEAMRPSDLRLLLARRPDGCRICNHYGPTETTVGVVACDLENAGGADVIPLGRPLPSTSVYILDGEGQPVPIGVRGELCVGGRQVTFGYRNAPAETAARFVPDPFSKVPGSRMYRTGDVARWRADGLLEFLGRADHQVKIRGFRIELGEIDAAISACDGVTANVVVVREDVPGDKRLVAYVVGRDVTAATLKTWLGTRLPAYMVPSAFVFLDELPLNANGKVDRKALPAPDVTDGATDFVAPRTPSEELVAAVFADLLKIERVGAHDDFFALGGHSLLATRLVARLTKAFGASVSVRTLFQSPSVAALAKVVGSASAAGAAPLSPIVRVDRTSTLRASFAQERMYFLDQLSPGSTAYSVPTVLRLRAEVDTAVLERALRELVARHESFRTTFTDANGELQQIVHPVDRFAVERRVASSETDARDIVRQAVHAPFDLARGPLFRPTLVRLPNGEHFLVLNAHHIVTDGWSRTLAWRELWSLYDAFAKGEPSPLAPRPLDYADYAAWQRQHLAGEELGEQLRFWKKHLEGAPPALELPTDHARPAMRQSAGGEVVVTLPEALTTRVKAVCRSEGVTPFMVLLAGYQALLARWSGQDDVVVGTPIAGRTREELEGIVGLFINTLALRARVLGRATFRELLAQVKDATLEAFAHQDVPFEKLVDELGVARDTSRTPVFQAMFALQNFDAEAPEANARYELENDGLVGAKSDLSLTLWENASRFEGALVYDAALFDRSTIERLVSHLATLLDAATRDPEQEISALPLMSEEERYTVVDLWNRTDEAVPAGATVYSLFEARATRTPDAVAVEFEGRRLTYRELRSLAERVAGWLVSRGVTVGHRIAVEVTRSERMLAALLGVMRAGGAYVPIDPAYPEDRRAYMRSDAGVVAELTDTTLEEALASDSNAPAPVQLAGDALAYVLYTSGSTGRPKGVMVPHGALANFVTTMARRPGLTAADVLVAVTTLSFDIAGLELYLPLTVGAKVVVASRDTATDPTALARLLEESGATVMQATPATWGALVASGWRPSSRLRVFCGGEAVGPELATVLSTGSAGLWNLYGPTETTIWSTCAAVEAGKRVTIGRPIGNTRVYVLDGRMQSAPIGVPGELFIGGAGVALGYHGRPELTAERFVADPFVGGGARMYRTGDVVRWLASGELEFFGRGDDQVKVRGFRIELGEVESALRSCDGVAAAAVAVRESGTGEKVLVGYVVGRAGQGPTAEELQGALRSLLPEYMVPSAFVALESLPLTPNGKVDRKALPAPDFAAKATEYVAPRTPVEEAIAGVFAQVLGLPRVGVHDDYFKLGGHSLSAMRMVARLRRDLPVPVDVALRQVFQTPTVAGLAAFVERAAAEATASPDGASIPLSRIAPDQPLQLSFAQERLWFLSMLEASSTAYTMRMAMRLVGPLSVEALEKSLAEILRRHEVLRMRVEDAGGTPNVSIAPAEPVSLPVEPLPSSTEESIRRRVEELVALPFDLTKGPTRFRLLRLSEQDHVLVIALHHIVSDGWSIQILDRELAILYDAFVAGEPPPLEPLPFSYFDYAAWQRTTMSSARTKEQLDYWLSELADAPAALDLPTDRPHAMVDNRRGGSETLRLSATVARRLRELSQGASASTFMTMLAAFSLLLARQAGQDDVVIGVPVAHRPTTELEGVVGMFLNTLALRMSIAKNPTFRELVVQAREKTLGGFAHQDLPFETIVEHLDPERSLVRTPVFQVMLVGLDFPKSSEALAGLKIAPVELPTPASKFDMTLYVGEGDDGVELSLVYAADFFDAARMRELLAELEALLEAAVAQPDAPVRSLSIVTPAARAVLPDPTAPLGDAWHGSVAQLFAEAAKRSPSHTAVVDDHERWTYGELEARSNQLAHALRASGCKRGDRVAIAAHRSASLPWALLGILKAGAAFVILDPAYPEARRVAILEASRPRALVHVWTGEDLPAELAAWARGAGATYVKLPRRSDAGELFAEHSSEAPAIEVGPDDLAYVAFTSGTTGKPKGVLGRHGPLSHFVPWRRRELGLSEDDRFSMVSGLAHDPLHRDVFLALALGASVHAIDPERMQEPGELAAWMGREGITVAHLTPSLGRLLTDTAAAGVELASLRRVFMVGEALTREDVIRLAQIAPHAEVVSYYGATESQQALSFYRVPRPGPGADEGHGHARFPLGKGTEDVQLLVVTQPGKLAGIGEVGEIHIRSPHLAAGYLDDPEGTAARFLANPLGTRRDDRVYRTGDLGRYTPSGDVVFVGRNDLQVKIRGFRVELEEVETALAAHPSVQEVVVDAREDANEGRYLVAYVVAQEAPTVDDLRSFLTSRLPSYMHPRAIVALERLPLTPNGKIDRKALPTPELALEYVAPRTPIEEAVTSVFAEVLAVTRVGVHDDFFDLGGHSLLATRVVGKLRKQLAVEATLRMLFEAPTAATLAPILESLLARDTGEI